MPRTLKKTTDAKRTVKPQVLRGIIRSIVEVAHPDKIVLFGSAARGEMGPNSDVDLLVIKSGKFNYWRVLNSIYRNLQAKDAAVDVVLVSDKDVEQYGNSPYLVIYPALKEGKVVYGA
jgi:uncharacterized protein